VARLYSRRVPAARPFRSASLSSVSFSAAEPRAPVAVAFVSSHALSGGSERYLELLLGELGREWARAVVSLEDGPFVTRLRALGHDVEVVPTPARLGILPAAWRLRRALLRRRPQLVHANGVKAALVAVLATPGTGIPVIWVKHDFSWDGPLARVVAWRCALVVAVSGAAAATFGRRLRGRVRVVPNGIPDYARDSGGRRAVAELVAAADAPVVALVGRLHRAKGQLELVEAAPTVLARRPDARFLLLGADDPNQPGYARAVRSRIAELGVGAAFTLAGHRDDPIRVMSGCDMVVLPSVADERGGGREACPFALLEAMSVEAPVVAYAVGGIPEVLGDCGRLVPEGDRAALADAIVALLAREGERERAAACARARVRERHSLERAVDAMRRAYLEVASG
jgi:glycosyltransferase involved in cell wall biosynthesis